MRSTKKLAFLDRFCKKFCCGAKNHPHGWKKQKRINVKAVRRRLKADNEYEVEVVTRGNCMMCGKELTEGLFFCKECESKGK